ncbi:UNKNOWN [Stylonychia lemnae]|uniref:Myeloid leukemia factor n=1 Tax=Stylonychia lemnae TaxID=5949 RepID=A0A077ZX62_STYLE|nr:UNKNOWN [Stylonychia lemnae]|eukprot:CDW73116.1 UNKNOWN [Stylonychia lemnae]
MSRRNNTVVARHQGNRANGGGGMGGRFNEFDNDFGAVQIFNNNRHDPFENMNNIMQNFGMPQMKMMMPFGRDDPFANDPFFNGGGFGGIDKMMKKMQKDMNNAMNSQSSMMSMNIGDGGQSHFVKQTYVSSTKLDQNGRPIQEKYQNKVAGTMGNGNKVVERQQMYDNSGTGLTKASHERMLNDKGRKVVKEKLGDQMNTYEHYKNMRDDEGSQFDQQWNQMSNQLGFKSGSSNNRLGYDNGRMNNSMQQRNLGSGGSLAIGYDDNRRGAYVNPQDRNQNAPVIMGRGNPQIDIAPTLPYGRIAGVQQNVRGPNPSGIQQNQPLAITDGSRPQQQRVAPQIQQQARVQSNNFMAPKAKGPARAH